MRVALGLLWLFSTVSHAGILYQTECQVYDHSESYLGKLISSVRGEDLCSEELTHALASGTLPNASVSGYTLAAGEPLPYSPWFRYAGRAIAGIEASDRIIIFAPDVASIVISLNGYVEGSLPEIRFQVNQHILADGLTYPWALYEITTGPNLFLSLAFELTSQFPNGPGDYSLFSIGGIWVYDSDGKTMDNFAWASEAGWYYPFFTAGPQLPYTVPEPSTLLLAAPGALLLVAFRPVLRRLRHQCG